MKNLQTTKLDPKMEPRINKRLEESHLKKMSDKQLKNYLQIKAISK